MGDSGKVMLLPRGDYNPATPYEELDCVYYQGRSYVCKEASTGHAPTDTTYWQPMTPDASAEIQALTNYVTDTGVKNQLPNNAATQTINGVTFTVNSDKSVTVNGTASDNCYFNLATKTFGDALIKSNTRENVPVGDWILTTGAQTDDKFYMAYNPENHITAIAVLSGKTVNNVTIYPMIRAATITDASYQPYAKTNVELTADTTYKTGNFTKASSDLMDHLSIKQFGKVITVNGYIESITASANSPFTLGTISGVDAPPVAIRTIAGVASAGYNPPEQIGYLSLSTGNSLAITVNEAIISKVLYFSFSYTI